MVDIELNDIEIFSKTYTHKINLVGYYIKNSYPDQDFSTQKITFLLESHRNKYILELSYVVKDNLATDIEIYADKCESFKIEEIDKIYDKFFFYTTKEQLILSPIENCKDNIFKSLTNIKNDFTDTLCFYNDNRIIFLDKIPSLPLLYYDKSEDVCVDRNQFIENINN